MKQSIIIVLIIVCLLAGSVGGYGVGYTIYEPKIKSYEKRVSMLTFEVGSLNSTVYSQQPQISTLQTNLSNAQKEILTLQANISALESERSKLQLNLAEAQKTISDYEIQVSSLKSQISTLQTQIRELQAQIANLQAQVSTLNAQIQSLTSQIATLQTQKNLAASQLLYIGTSLETYYDYVRANYLTFGLTSVSEERWDLYPDYYSISVTFAAELASHDIGNCYWTALESGCHYLDETGEYSYQTSSRIMQRAISITGISYSDSNVTKIQKILAFIHSLVHHETRLLDHMWFPTETLTFRSGDCSGFSILASAMFEEVGIKSAVAFFTNSTLGAHAMVLVHLDNLGQYGYSYYSDLTSLGLTSGKWIIIEPQFSSLDYQQSNLRWISYWTIDLEGLHLEIFAL